MEVFACMAKTGGHRSHGDVEHLGNFRHAHSFELEHDEHDAKALLELGEQLVEESARTLLVEELLRRRRRVRRLDALGEPVHRHFARALAFHLGRDSKCGSEEERALAARRDVVGAAERDEEEILRGVVDEVLFEAKPSKEPPHAREVLPYEPAEVLGTLELARGRSLSRQRWITPCVLAPDQIGSSRGSGRRVQHAP